MKCTMNIVWQFRQANKEIGCSLSFNSLAKYSMELRTKSNGISVFHRPSNHHGEAQRPGQPTPPFTPRDAERPWEGHN